MKSRRYILILTLMVLSVLPAFSQVKVEGRLSTTKMQIGDQTELRLEVTAQEGMFIEFPVFKPEQEITPGIEVVETKGDTVNAGGNQKTISRIYSLTSWDGNQYEVPAQKVKVNGKVYTTNNIPLTVEEVPIDSLNPAPMRPAKEIMENPFLWSEWSPLFWLSLLAVVFASCCYYLFLRLRDNKPIISRIRFVKRLLPHQKAMQSIERIKNEAREGEEDQKVYYTQLTQTLREYLEERFGISAMEMTSSEIIFRLQQEEDQAKIDELRRVFETADLVKFAKYSTEGDEKEMYMAQVVEFIQTTKQEKETVVEQVKDELTEEEKRSNRSSIMVKTTLIIFLLASVALFVYVAYQAYQLIG